MSTSTPSTPRPVIPARWRDYLYPIATAAALLLGGYGVIADEQIPLWIGLAGALLGTSTATAYRPSRSIPDGTGEHRADE